MVTVSDAGGTRVTGIAMPPSIGITSGNARMANSSLHRMVIQCEFYLTRTGVLEYGPFPAQ